jgi:hypothetical protein
MRKGEAAVALDSAVRRQVVQLLVADGGELDVEALADRLVEVAGGDGSRRAHRIELHHVHLPKLADAGLVVWDTDAGTVRPTPTAKGVVAHPDAGAAAHGDD